LLQLVSREILGLALMTMVITAFWDVTPFCGEIFIPISRPDTPSAVCLKRDAIWSTEN